MFDIFGNKKKDELLRYIDDEISVMTGVIDMNNAVFRNSSGNSQECINHKTAILQHNQIHLAVLEELRRIRKEIERIYS